MARGRPAASTRPWSSTTKRSARRIIACIVCSMMQIVAFLSTEPGQRLVEQEQPRMASESAGQLHEAQLLVCELAGRHARLIGQPHLTQGPHRGDGGLAV